MRRFIQNTIGIGLYWTRSFIKNRTRALEVIPNVYQLTSNGANMLLIAEENLTLIDTGFRGSSGQIIKFIQGLGRSVEEVRLIILTHNHFDHAGGLPELRKLTLAKVAVHHDDIGEPKGYLPYRGFVRRVLRMSVFSALRSVLLIRASDVDMQLWGGEVLEPLGGLQVIHTPGHTPGSISLFSSREKLFIVSDALNKRRGNLRLPNKAASLNFPQAIDSVKRMARLDFDIVCFGHGRPLTENVQTKMRQLMESIKRIDNID